MCSSRDKASTLRLSATSSSTSVTRCWRTLVSYIRSSFSQQKGFRGGVWCFGVVVVNQSHSSMESFALRGLCAACRHARGRPGHFQADAARQASHDVLGHAVRGDPSDHQEVHVRRMSPSWPAPRSARRCRGVRPASLRITTSRGSSLRRTPHSSSHQHMIE